MTISIDAHSDFNAEDQVIELMEDQLEDVEGGFSWLFPPEDEHILQ